LLLPGWTVSSKTLVTSFPCPTSNYIQAHEDCAGGWLYPFLSYPLAMAYCSWELMKCWIEFTGWAQLNKVFLFFFHSVTTQDYWFKYLCGNQFWYRSGAFKFIQSD
jgi:hypothetical protein